MNKDFEEEWGFSPDSDYEIRKCNKTDEELAKIAEWYCSHEITAVCYNRNERNE